MNNKEVFVEKLNASGEVKYEMSEVFSRILGRIKDVYSIAFKREKRDFLTLKNMMYYRGDETNETPRLHEFLNTFISLVNHYEFLEDDEIKTYLKEHGVEITLVTPQFSDDAISISKEDNKNFARAWNFSMNNEKVPETKKELLNAILDRSIEIQKTIEDKKEEINKNAEEVDIECQIKKSFFMKALGIKVQEIKKKSVDNQLKKIEDDIESSRDIISVFDEKEEEASE